MGWRIKPLDEILANAEKKSLRRSLGAFHLMMLGVGAIIGTGIFVLTAEAAQKAGPGMMGSFVIAGFVCAVTALCYAEIAAMVPVSGSAYTYSYAVLGEVVAWIVGWALVLEYAVAASAVSVGWSNYFVGLMARQFDFHIPLWLSKGIYAGGFINLPAVIIAMLVTSLLVIGTKESATVNAILVGVKIVALTIFVAISIPIMNMQNFEPFAPLGMAGIGAGAASIFFAYVGFDAVSTAAEETKNPQRNMPIGLIGSLIICTVFYLLVASGAIGSVDAQPIMDSAGNGLPTGSAALIEACKSPTHADALACHDEPLAFVLAHIGWDKMSRLIGLAAFLALPSVVLMMMFGQTRIFFVMSRDGLLPPVLSRVHAKFGTPHVVTMITGAFVMVAAAFLPVGDLADVSNSGTLLAFFVVALGVLMLRRSDPDRKRPFRTPAIWIVGPLALLGCLYLFYNLSTFTKVFFSIWTAIGLVVYFLYGYKRSQLAPDYKEP